MWKAYLPVPAYTFQIISLNSFSGPDSYDIGWHFYCALGYAFVPANTTVQDSLWVTAGPDSQGRMDWTAGLGYTGSAMYAMCF